MSRLLFVQALTGSAADRDAFFNNIIMTLVRQRESGFYKMMLGTFKKELKRAVGGSLARAEEATRRAEAADKDVQAVASRLNRTVVLFNEERKQFYKNLLMLQEQVKLARQAAAEALAAAGILDLDSELMGDGGNDSDGSDPPPLLTQGSPSARTTLHSSSGNLHKHRGGGVMGGAGGIQSSSNLSLSSRSAALMDARRSLNALRRLEESITGNASSLASRLTASARRLGDASESPEATDMRELEEENDKLRRDLDEAHAAISRLAGEASSRYKQVVDLREKYAALRGTLSGRDGEVADVKQVVLALEKQLQVAQAENEALVAELDAGEGGEVGASSPSVGGSVSGLASLVSPGSRGGGFGRRGGAAAGSSGGAAESAWYGPQATHWGRAARGALRSAVAQGTAQWRGGAAGVVELLMDPDLRASVQDAYTALTLSGEVAAVEAGSAKGKGGAGDSGGGSARGPMKVGGVSLKGSAARKRRGRNLEGGLGGGDTGAPEPRGGGALGFLSGGGASKGGLDEDEDTAEALATAVADVEMLQAQLHSSNSSIKALQGEVRAMKAAATRERGMPPPREDIASQTDDSWLQGGEGGGDEDDDTASDAGSEVVHHSGLSVTGHEGGAKGAKGGRRPIRRREDKRRTGSSSPRGSKGGKGGSSSGKPSASGGLGKRQDGPAESSSERPTSASSSYRPSRGLQGGGAVPSQDSASSQRADTADTRDATEGQGAREGSPQVHGQGPWAFLPGDTAPPPGEEGGSGDGAERAASPGQPPSKTKGRGSTAKGGKGRSKASTGRPDTSQSVRSVCSVEDSREMRVIAKLQGSLAEEEKYSAMLERKLKRAGEEGGGLREKNAQLKRELRAAVAAVEAARTKLAEAAAAGGGAGESGGGALQLLQAYKGPSASMFAGEEGGTTPTAAGAAPADSFPVRPPHGKGRAGAASPLEGSLESGRPASSLHGRSTPEGILIEEEAPDDEEFDVEEPSFVVRSIGGGAGGAALSMEGGAQAAAGSERQDTTGSEAGAWGVVPVDGDAFGSGSAVGSTRGGMMGLGDDEGGIGGAPSSRASTHHSGAPPHISSAASMSWQVAVRSVGVQVGAAGGKSKADSRKPPTGKRRRAFNSDGTAAAPQPLKPTSWWEVERGVTAGTQTRISGSVLPVGGGTGAQGDPQLEEEAIQAIMAEMQMGTSDGDFRSSSPRSDGSGAGQRSPVPHVLASNPGTGPSREDLAETVLRLKREVARWKYHVSETQRSTSAQGGGGGSTDYAALDRAVSRGGSRGGSRAGTFVPGNLPVGSAQHGSFPLGGVKGGAPGVFRPLSSQSGVKGADDTRASGPAWAGVAGAGTDGAAAAVAASEAVLRATAERVRVLEDTVTHLLSGPQWRLTGDDAAGTTVAAVTVAQAAAAAAVVLREHAPRESEVSSKGGTGGAQKNVKWKGVSEGPAEAAKALHSLTKANAVASAALASADVHSLTATVKGSSKWLQRLLASYAGSVLAQHAAVTGEVLTAAAEGKVPEGGLDDPEGGGSDDESLAAAVHKKLPARVTWLALAQGVEGLGKGGQGALRESLLYTRLSAALVGVFGGGSASSHITHMPSSAPGKEAKQGGVSLPFTPPTTGWLVLNLLQATDQWQQAQGAVAASKWRRMAWAAKARGLLQGGAAATEGGKKAPSAAKRPKGLTPTALAAVLRLAHRAKADDVARSERTAGRRVLAAVAALVQLAPWATSPPTVGGGGLHPRGGVYPGVAPPYPMPSDSMMQYHNLGGPTSVYRGPMPPQRRGDALADPAATAAAAVAASGWWGAPRAPPGGGEEGDPVDPTRGAVGGNRAGTVFRGRAGTGPGSAGGMYGPGGVWMSDGSGEEGYQFGAPPPHLAHLYGGMDAASLLRVAAGGGMRPGDASYLTQAARAMVAAQGMPPPWYMQGGVASPEEWQAAVQAAQGGRAEPGGGPSYFNVQGGAVPMTAGAGGVFPTVDPRVPPPMYQSQDGALWNPFYNYAAVTLYHTAYGPGVRGQGMISESGEASSAGGSLRTTGGGVSGIEAGRRDRGLLYAPEALQESKEGGGAGGAGGVSRGASFRIPAFAASRGPMGETLAPGASNIWADASHTARGGAAANLGGVLGRKMSLPSMAEMRALEASGGGVGASRGRRLRAASGAADSDAGSDAAAAAGSVQGSGGVQEERTLHNAASGRSLLVAGETPHPPRATRVRHGLAHSATMGGGAMMGQAARQAAPPAHPPQSSRMPPVAETAPHAAPLQHSQLHLNLGGGNLYHGGGGDFGAAVPPSPLLRAGHMAVKGPHGDQQGGGHHRGVGPITTPSREGGRPDSGAAGDAGPPWQAAFTDHVYETQARRGGGVDGAGGRDGGRRSGVSRWAEVPPDADSLQVSSARIRPRARAPGARLHETSRL